MANKANPLKQAHGSEYSAFVNAIHRCHRPHHKAYPNYGARGITVCPQWMHKVTGFKAFIDYLGPKPSPELSLDRIDNDKGYEPGNVRWATRSTQQLNRRRRPRGPLRRRFYTYQGLTMSGPDWAEHLGISYQAFNARVTDGHGEEAVFYAGRLPRGKINGSTELTVTIATTPRPTSERRPYGKLYTFNGKSLTLAQWGAELGVNSDTLRHRLHTGWTVEEAMTIAVQKQTKKVKP